ncbi:hypothetical protein Pcinc_034854 [Petrolisthes cinctipes]|uniref:Uncharacterized protein n=1 Tax=Petrolisthes cinctipes TaxID=88211 RepID=A0AAE1BXW5_PETCI|nr:hypothetical protein Pcinc_034854 [Petrolisthes cinctipes]
MQLPLIILLLITPGNGVVREMDTPTTTWDTNWRGLPVRVNSSWSTIGLPFSSPVGLSFSSPGHLPVPDVPEKEEGGTGIKNSKYDPKREEGRIIGIRNFIGGPETEKEGGVRNSKYDTTEIKRTNKNITYLPPVIVRARMKNVQETNRTDENTKHSPTIVSEKKREKRTIVRKRREHRDPAVAANNNIMMSPRRIMLFTTLDAWVAAFQQTFKRDMIFNVGKVGGLILLHYLAPDLLAWFTDTFGSFG